MTTAEPAVPLTDGGTEDYHNPDHVVPFGHPRRGLRAIPRYPMSLSDIEAMQVAFSITKGINDTSGKTYPVKQGGIPAWGS